MSMSLSIELERRPFRLSPRLSINRALPDQLSASFLLPVNRAIRALVPGAARAAARRVRASAGRRQLEVRNGEGWGRVRCGAVQTLIDIVLASHPAAPLRSAGTRCGTTGLSTTLTLSSSLCFGSCCAHCASPRLHRSCSSSSSEPQKERAAICRVSERASRVRPSGLGSRSLSSIAH